VTAEPLEFELLVPELLVPELLVPELVLPELLEELESSDQVVSSDDMAWSSDESV
jgi:hypothetical protein